MKRLILFLLAGFAVVTCGGSTEPGQSQSPIYDTCSESSECVIHSQRSVSGDHASN